MVLPTSDDFKQIKDEMIYDGVLPTAQAERWEPVAVNDLSDFKKIEPYHVRKGIDLHGAVQVGSDIVVPIVDITGKRVNQQTITPNPRSSNRAHQLKGNFLAVGGKLEVFAIWQKDLPQLAVSHKAPQDRLSLP